MVDDDPLGVSFFRTSLQICGYEVDAAASASRAKKLIERSGSEAYDAVLTDFRMPNETGLELLVWVLKLDPSLSTVIVTAQGERDLVKRSMSEGAAGYLDKPVTHSQLKGEISKAVGRTHRLRRYASNEAGLKEAARFDTIWSTLVSREVEDHLRYVYRPLREVGGDFLNAVQLSDGSFLIVVGDISGHDIKAAFVSSYFQGMLRGFVDEGIPEEKCLVRINTLLAREQRSPTFVGQLPTSLAVATVRIHPKKHWATVMTSGFPAAVLVDEWGFCTECGQARAPLGWDETTQFSPDCLTTKPYSLMMLFTDGVIDTAQQLGINHYSILFRFCVDGDVRGLADDEPVDDILAICFRFDTQREYQSMYKPIFQEEYSGDEHVEIDELQEIWQRSLRYAIGDRLGDRLFDLVICIREGMLNAFLHGCESSSQKFCRLQIAFCEAEDTVRVRIDDPGKGHQFDMKKRLQEIGQDDGRRLGLTIIDHLSDSVEFENEGASLIFDYRLAVQSQ